MVGGVSDVRTCNDSYVPVMLLFKLCFYRVMRSWILYIHHYYFTLAGSAPDDDSYGAISSIELGHFHRKPRKVLIPGGGVQYVSDPGSDPGG